jgi:hypothetical protein
MNVRLRIARRNDEPGHRTGFMTNLPRLSQRVTTGA